MQISLNRLMPIASENVVMRDGRMFPTLRKDVALKKIIVVSSCGFWGTDNFSVLLHFVERLAKTLNVEFAVVSLRPHELMMKERQDEQTTRDILEAAVQAGYQLIQEGQIKQKTLETIKQLLTSLKELHKRNRKAHEKAQNLSPNKHETL